MSAKLEEFLTATKKPIPDLIFFALMRAFFVLRLEGKKPQETREFQPKVHASRLDKIAVSAQKIELLPNS